MGVYRAHVGLEAERASRLESSRSLTFGCWRLPCRNAMRAAARREQKRRDLIARAACTENRVGLTGLIDQQVATHQVHAHASADDPRSRPASTASTARRQASISSPAPALTVNVTSRSASRVATSSARGCGS